MKKVLAICLSVALLATAVIGGAMAYLTDTDSDVNVMTVGNVKIEQIEQERDASGNLVEFKQNKPAYPRLTPLHGTTKNSPLTVRATWCLIAI